MKESLLERLFGIYYTYETTRMRYDVANVYGSTMETCFSSYRTIVKGAKLDDVVDFCQIDHIC